MRLIARLVAVYQWRCAYHQALAELRSYRAAELADELGLSTTEINAVAAAEADRSVGGLAVPRLVAG